MVSEMNPSSKVTQAMYPRSAPRSGCRAIEGTSQIWRRGSPESLLRRAECARGGTDEKDDHLDTSTQLRGVVQ